MADCSSANDIAFEVSRWLAFDHVWCSGEIQQLIPFGPSITMANDLFVVSELVNHILCYADIDAIVGFSHGSKQSRIYAQAVLADFISAMLKPYFSLQG